MKAHMIAALALVLMASPASAADTKACSTPEAEAAERGVDALHSWSDLHAAFKKFGHCDDGAIAEGYSDFVMRMLASRWDELGALQTAATADPAFRAFVLSHIDETWVGVEFEKVMQSARTHCPARARGLCLDILKSGSKTASDTDHTQ